jgi:hypothetical protein
MEINEFFEIPQIREACNEGYSIYRITREWEGYPNRATVVLKKENRIIAVDINILTKQFHSETTMEIVKQVR